MNNRTGSLIRFKRGLFVVSLLSASLFMSINAEPLLLVHDRANNARRHATLVYIPGHGVPSENYVSFLTRLQDDMASYNTSLHVAIVQYPKLGGHEYPPFIGLNSLVEQAIQQVKQQALLKSLNTSAEDLPIFLGGHSLGSILAQMVAYENPSLYKGLLIHGGYVMPKYHHTPLLIPTLTLTGTRDGLNRYTYVAMQHKDIRSTDPCNNYFQHDPTILLEGMNHYQIADNAPPYMKNRDLEQIISTRTAQSLVSKLSTTFLLQQMNVAVADGTILEEYVLRSEERYYEPYILAMESDESGETCALAQRMHLGMPESTQIESNQSRNIFSFTFSKPRGNETQVTVEQLPSKAFTWFGRSSVPQAVQTLRCKMLSKEQVFGQASLDFDSCASMNEAIFQRALFMLPYDVQETFWSSGSTVVFGQDSEASSGIAWLSASLNVTTLHNGTTIVHSPRLKTSLGDGRYSGKLYCALLPMLRAIEYITIDSMPKAKVVATE